MSFLKSFDNAFCRQCNLTNLRVQPNLVSLNISSSSHPLGILEIYPIVSPESDIKIVVIFLCKMSCSWAINFNKQTNTRTMVKRSTSPGKERTRKPIWNEKKESEKMGKKENKKKQAKEKASHTTDATANATSTTAPATGPATASATGQAGAPSAGRAAAQVASPLRPRLRARLRHRLQITEIRTMMKVRQRKEGKKRIAARQIRRLNIK